MEKLNYSELLQPAIEKIQKDIEADKRGYDEPSNALLIIAAQVSANEDEDDIFKYTMMGNGTMLAALIMQRMDENEEFASIIQEAVDVYRYNKMGNDEI